MQRCHQVTAEPAAQTLQVSQQEYQSLNSQQRQRAAQTRSRDVSLTGCHHHQQQHD